MRTLLSSASDLVHLDISNIPDSGHISPETMAISLSYLTQLKALGLGFHPRDFVHHPRQSHPFLVSRRQRVLGGARDAR